MISMGNHRVRRDGSDIRNLVHSTKMLRGSKEMCEEVLPNLLIYVTGDFTRGKSGSHIRFAQMIELAITRFHNVIV